MRPSYWILHCVQNNKQGFAAGIDVPRHLATIPNRHHVRQFIAMPALPRLLLFALSLVPFARAAAPADLVAALERLSNQKSYSWETINADPGPVAQEFKTRRGTYVNVQRNMAPNVKGQIDRNGDIRLQREWSDGLRLDTIILKDGASVTQTPEGWMTEKEILTAQADESIRSQTASPRAIWLRRADRPDPRPPDQELAPFLKSPVNFEVQGNAYTARIRFNSTGQPSTAEDGEPATTVTVTMNLSGGAVRDYEIKIEGTRREGRSRIGIPVSEQRIVIITYLPVSRITIPPEAKEKLDLAKLPAGGTK
jgi:hypothetical protein